MVTGWCFRGKTDGCFRETRTPGEVFQDGGLRWNNALSQRGPAKKVANPNWIRNLKRRNMQWWSEGLPEVVQLY